MLPSSAVQRAACWLMCSCCPALCLPWIHGDPVSLVRQSFPLWGLHSLGEGKECTIWVSHTPFLFQSCGTSLAFRGRPGEKGELERAAVPGPGSAISSCWLVVQALTEPPSAWSVFPDKGRSWALGSCPSLGDSVNETSLPADLQNLWGEGVPSLLPIRTGYVCRVSLFFFLFFLCWLPLHGALKYPVFSRSQLWMPYWTGQLQIFPTGLVEPFPVSSSRRKIFLLLMGLKCKHLLGFALS